MWVCQGLSVWVCGADSSHDVDSLAHPVGGGSSALSCPCWLSGWCLSATLPSSCRVCGGHVQAGLHMLVQQQGTSGGQGLRWCPNLPKAHICLLFPCPPAAGGLTCVSLPCGFCFLQWKVGAVFPAVAAPAPPYPCSKCRPGPRLCSQHTLSLRVLAHALCLDLRGLHCLTHTFPLAVKI